MNVQLKLLKLYITATMRYLATLLVTLLLAVPAISVELFRYRYRAEDGGEFEYIFEADEQSAQNRKPRESGRNCGRLGDRFLSRTGRSN